MTQVDHFVTSPLPIPRPTMPIVQRLRSSRTLLEGDFHINEPTSKRAVKELQERIEEQMISDMKAECEAKVFEFTDALEPVVEGVQLLVADDFTRCFEQRNSTAWNWNIYLFPLWAVGVFVRYGIVFPVRLLILALGWIIFATGFVFVKLFLATSKRRPAVERQLIVFLSRAFVASWTGVIRFHGTAPPRKANQIYVANHTSMADVLVLMMQQAYAVVGQSHPGWVGMAQKHVLGCLGCLWFNRDQQSDRAHVAESIMRHIGDVNKPPLLIFPEGTCVNNEYCVQFKKGVFDMDATIIPIAIKYNKIFADAFWNSRKESFAWYLYRLMTSWCVVADVYYLDATEREKDEDGVAFAERVKKAICAKARLTPVPWDGYLKYFKMSPKYIQERQKAIANALLAKLVCVVRFWKNFFFFFV
eukprot:TRINITY_DN1379_c0_g1_i3.p1 TRINITY_DN1379_c0_g1~~TRINITY_DN1379_c0_g1_i3.p1  ORF type:complete len:417 (+),score=93.67 TRINITY_DN1379_c0_g1_i3:84-1334(+)